MPACSFYRLKLHMGPVGRWETVLNLPGGESLLLHKVCQSLLSFENPKQGLFLKDVIAEAGKQRSVLSHLNCINCENCFTESSNISEHMKSNLFLEGTVFLQ